MNEYVLNLALWQIWLVGLVASLLVALVNWLAKGSIKLFGKTYGWKPVHVGRFWLTIILLIVAAGLGYWWYPFALPPWPTLAGLDLQAASNAILDYAALVVQCLLPYIGAAMALYNLLLNYFTDPAKRKEIWKNVKDWLMKRLGVPEI